MYYMYIYFLVQTEAVYGSFIIDETMIKLKFRIRKFGHFIEVVNLDSETNWQFYVYIVM